MEQENSVHAQKCAFRAYEGNQIAHFTTYSRTLRNNASVINVKPSAHIATIAMRTSIAFE